MISTQRSTGSLFGEIRWRTPSCSTSAAVPGRRAEPALDAGTRTPPRGELARALAHEVHLHRRVRVQVHVGRDLLDEPQPAPVVLERVVGMDAALHADLGDPEVDRLAHLRRRTSSSVDVVRVRRALALAEAAERAADLADVREVDVAVDDERGRVAGEPRAQLVGGAAACPRSPRAGARRTARSARRASARCPSRARSIARGRQVGADRRRPWRRPEPAARDERPVLELDRVEHALRDPVRIDVLRVHAQALGQRVALRLQPLAHLVRARERMLGRDVVAVGRQPAEVGRALAHERRATSPRGWAGSGCRRPASARGSGARAASCRRP